MSETLQDQEARIEGLSLLGTCYCRSIVIKRPRRGFGQLRELKQLFRGVLNALSNAGCLP